MPKPPLPPELDQFLKQPNPSVIATLQEDGRPHSTPTWYVWENGRVLVNMDESRKRLSYLRDDPRVSITVLGKDEWYRHVTLQGRVASLEADPELVDIDRISSHYTGNPYGQRDRGRISAWIEVDWWHSWRAGQPWTGSG
jgi:PPOX class probable F420-dependent enzyme